MNITGVWEGLQPWSWPGSTSREMMIPSIGDLITALASDVSDSFSAAFAEVT